MFIFFYPVDGNLERHTFDTMLDQEGGVKKALDLLFAEERLHFYDLTQQTQKSRFPCVPDLVEDYNDEELDIGWWCVTLPINEKELTNYLQERTEDDEQEWEDEE